MPVLYPTFSTLAAELGDTIGRTLQKILETLRRGPVSGTALASAARTTTTNSADITTTGYRGINVYVDVTANPGLGGLRVGLTLKDPVTGKLRTLVHTSTLITANSIYVVQFGPGIGTLNGATIPTGQCGLCGVQLAQVVQVSIVHTTADSYTYSASYELLP